MSYVAQAHVNFGDTWTSANENQSIDNDAYLYAVSVTNGGWIPATGVAWTYASATTISVPSGAASIYSVGDKIRIKQGAGYKYYYVVVVADTLLTVTGGSDFTVANAAITDNYYSKATSPVGFPATFNTNTRVVMSMQGNMVTILAWGWLVGDGVHAYLNSAAFSFGITLVHIPYILVSCIGYKDSSDPANIGDFSSWGEVHLDAGGSSVTGCNIAGENVAGVTVGSARRVGYALLATGPY